MKLKDTLADWSALRWAVAQVEKQRQVEAAWQARQARPAITARMTVRTHSRPHSRGLTEPERGAAAAEQRKHGAS